MSSVERHLELDHFVRDERALVDACDSVVHATRNRRRTSSGRVAATSRLPGRAVRSNTVDVLAELLDQRDDQLAAIAGVHASVACPALWPPPSWTRHSTTNDGSSPSTPLGRSRRGAPHRPAMDRLASMVTDGGFRGMVAQRTLAGWAHGDRNGVLLALGKSLEHADGAGRVALIETVGAIPGTAATVLLETVAFDNDDADAVAGRNRGTGMASERPGSPRTPGVGRHRRR